MTSNCPCLFFFFVHLDRVGSYWTGLGCVVDVDLLSLRCLHAVIYDNCWKIWIDSDGEDYDYDWDENENEDVDDDDDSSEDIFQLESIYVNVAGSCAFCKP